MRLSGAVDDATRVGGEFYAEENNLCAIAVRLQFANHPGEGIVRLRLRELASGDQDLTFADVELSRAPNNDWCLFLFDQIRNSAGRRFYFLVDLINNSQGSDPGHPGRSMTSEAAGLHFRNYVAIESPLAFRVYSNKQFRYAASLTKPDAASSLK